MNEEAEIVDLMRAEAAFAEPPSRIVDVGRAMTAGRRQRWYGRAAGTVLVVAVLVAGVVAVPRVLGPAGSTGYDVAAAPEVPDLPTMPATAVAPAGFDPSVSYLRFGWTPGGYTERSFQVGATANGPMAFLQATPVIAYDWQGVSVTLYPRGVTPPPPQRENGLAKALHTTRAAGSGQDATWTVYSGATGREAFLSWRYAAQGWARVRVADDKGDVQSIALQVAETLKLSGTDPVSLPMRVATLPGGLNHVETEVDESTAPQNAPWYAAMSFSAARNAQQQSDQALVVSVTPYRGQDVTGGKGYNPPNTTIDGHPASQVPPTGPTTDLTMYHVGGVNVEVEVTLPNVASLLGPQGCVSAYQRVTLIPGAGGWTTGLRG